MKKSRCLQNIALLASATVIMADAASAQQVPQSPQPPANQVAPAQPAAQPAAPGATAPAPGTDATLPPVQVIQQQPKPQPPSPPAQVAKKPKAPKPQVAEAAPPPAAVPATTPPPPAPLTTSQQRAQGDIVRVAPIGGSEVAIEKVPGAVSTVSADAISSAGSNEPQDVLQKEVPGVIIGDVAGNDLRTQIEYRGFEAGGVNGFPQGLAVYQNGVRINEVFGDTVNWDLIPKNAISDITVLTGNPVFGLNAVGGAISVVWVLANPHFFTAPAITAGALLESNSRYLAMAATLRPSGATVPGWLGQVVK